MRRETDAPTAQRELERVLQSAGFARNERLSRFLRFVVERHLDGRDSEIKESLIAIEVFGRRPDYDPKLDSIVRTEAGRLRARLAEYYADEGSGDSVVIELPKGGYAPVFHLAETSQPPPRQHRLKVGLAALLVVLAAASGSWWLQRKSEPIPIAVLPLENLDRAVADEDFADGLTDEIISSLSMIEGLGVRSRTSAFAFKGKPRNMREAGRQLGVDYILEGSVLRAGEKLRVNVQLVRVRDDFALWSGRFDRELTDIFVIQSEISQAIVNQLRLNLGQGRRRYETNLEAYDLYLRARALTSRRRPADLREAIELYGRVIAKDIEFAPAYAGLAATYSRLSVNRAMNSAEAQPKMRAAAERAIQLDPLLAEAHAALGLVEARDRQWDLAEKSFRRSIKLDPNRAATYVDFAGGVLMELGRMQECIGQLRLAQKAEPLSAEVHQALAFALISAGEYDEAADHCQRALALDPNEFNIHQYLARARLGQGRTEEAIGMLTGARTNDGFLGYAYARSGRREEAEKLAASTPDRPNVQALIYAGLGDSDRTFSALDRMVALNDERVRLYLTYPELAVIRHDPRLNAFRTKVGLPNSGL